MSPSGTQRTCQACTIMSAQQGDRQSFESSEHFRWYPQAVVARIEIPQRSSLLRLRCAILSVESTGGTGQ